MKQIATDDIMFRKGGLWLRMRDSRQSQELVGFCICISPPGPSGQGVRLLIRRLRVRVLQGGLIVINIEAKMRKYIQTDS